MRRTRTRASAAVALGFALAGCSMASNMPSFNLVAASAEPNLTIDSNPPGAVASLSNGEACRTPCALSAPVTDPLTVTYTLEGYLPQTVAVRPVPVPRTALVDMTPPVLEPNPVRAELQPAPPPPPPPPPPVVKKRNRP
jgi:hypothetical protein